MEDERLTKKMRKRVKGRNRGRPGLSYEAKSNKYGLMVRLKVLDTGVHL